MNAETILKQTTSFRDDLLKDLTDTEFAIYYLEAALADYKEDSNTESLWIALRDVVEAQGGKVIAKL
jgi:DNA-binding phage protein